VALGGIDVPTAREVRAAGAHGVAVIGALWRARDPLRAAEELVAAVA
jgi:thiamine-phosphate pyrophosphorylase